MTDYKTFAQKVQAMREYQKKRERSSAHLLVKQCRELELGVDEMLLELFGKKKEVEQPKMEL